MKKLIFRKIIKDITIFFLLMCMTIGIIVWTLQAVNYLDFVIEDGHGLKTYFLYSLYNFPKIINRLVPFILFITLIYVISNYDSKNELIIFWTFGVSKNEFVNKIIIYSIFLTIIQIFLSGFVTPSSQYKARAHLKNSNIDYFTSLIKNGKFINVVDGLTIFINSKDGNGNFKNIFIDDSSKINTRIIYAKSGYLDNQKIKKKFKLFDGKVINKNNNNEINIFNFEQIDLNLSEYTSSTILVPKIQELPSSKLFKCFNDLNKNKEVIIRDDDFACQISIKKEITQELFKRFYKPIYIPIISILSCYLIILSKNNNGYRIKKLILYLSIFFILIISEGSLRYSTNSFFTTCTYLALPILFFITIFYFFRKRLRYV